MTIMKVVADVDHVAVIAAARVAQGMDTESYWVGYLLSSGYALLARTECHNKVWGFVYADQLVKKALRGDHYRNPKFAAPTALGSINKALKCGRTLYSSESLSELQRVLIFKMKDGEGANVVRSSPAFPEQVEDCDD